MDAVTKPKMILCWVRIAKVRKECDRISENEIVSLLGFLVMKTGGVHMHTAVRHEAQCRR